MIYKVLVGNEHGGAAMSSKEIIDSFINDQDFAVVFLCNGEFCQKMKGHKNVFAINSFEPPVLVSDTFFKRIINYVKFLFWIFLTVLKFGSFIREQKVRYIHTTNNHALLVTLLSKFFNKSLYIISHWRCVGLASASKYISILHKIDKVFCISNVVKHSLPDFLQAKSIVVYNGVDVKMIEKEGVKHKGFLREQLHFSFDDFVIGTIGTFTSIKCHELLIDTLPYLSIKNLKLVLFGSSPNKESIKYLSYLKEKVSTMELESQVFFLMDSDYPLPKRFIVDFDLFVGATWNSGSGEGFGLIYTEAMAQRLPVIAINVGAANEIILDKETGFLIQNNDPKELAAVIQQAFINKDILKEYGNNGFSRVIRNFDISIGIDKLKALYKEVQKC